MNITNVKNKKKDLKKIIYYKMESIDLVSIKILFMLLRYGLC